MVKITPINNPEGVTQQEYDNKQEVLIPYINSPSLFEPGSDKVIFSLETITGELLYQEEIKNYSIRTDKDATSIIVVNPEKNTLDTGYNIGTYNSFYNFYRTALDSNLHQYFIKEISPTRTELRLSVNEIENEEIEILVNNFIELLQSDTLFKDFYIKVGNNYYIANNVLLDKTAEDYTVLIKLYQPLPPSVTLNTQLEVLFETSETVGFTINFPSSPIQLSNVEYIKGPNFNYQLSDQTNNSTTEQDFISLSDNTQLTSSYNQLQNILNQKGIYVNIDYTDFSNFVHFGSAKQRILNFDYKVGLIEFHNNEINSLLTITGSTSSSLQVSSSIAYHQNEITNTIKNFDGYENYLYYTSGALAWPKSNSTAPYILYSTSSSEVEDWLGNITEQTGILYSASVYDDANQDNLFNSVPKYIKDDPINAGYELFLNMVGQHFDELYSYINTITDRYDADNRLDYGISKDLVADALKSMGINLYQNNFSSDDLYSALLGINASGSLLPPTGSEVIEEYITAPYHYKGLALKNTEYYINDVFYYYYGNDKFWVKVISPTYTTPNELVGGVQWQLGLFGDQGVLIEIEEGENAFLSSTKLDDVNKEVYKRIYHNLPYLLKKKGTVEGLRALINIYGIPDTILRISEFGGKDKDNTNDWDYFQNKYNYALYNNGPSINNRVSTPWMVNPKWGTNNNRPESIFFRFKPTDLPTSSIEDTLLYISSSTPLYLKLSYTGSNLSGSYSGSIPSSSKEYATLTLLVSASEAISNYEYTPTSITPEYFSINGIEAYNNFTASIIESSSLIPPSLPLSSSLSAPFYNGDWWGVNITKNLSQYTLHVSNKIYDGNDGFKLGESISSSLNILSVSDIGNNNLDLTPYLGIRRIISSSFTSPSFTRGHIINFRYDSGSLLTLDVTQAKQIRFGAELDTSSPEDFPSIPPASIPDSGSVLLYKKNDTASYAKFSYSSYQNIGQIYKILGAAVPNEADNLSTLVFTESSSNTPFSDGDEIMAVLYSGSSTTPDISWYSSSYISSSLTTHSLSVSGSWTSSYNNTISWDSGSLLTLHSSNSLLQELRYYNITQSEAAFHDYVMNPYSIEGSNYSSSADNLIFRAPLGSDLNISTGTLTSIHPKISGSHVTKSFIINSDYLVGTNLTYYPQTEFIYYDQPAVGIKNRISQKIRYESAPLPSGDTLTPYRSIQQRYPQSESYTRDVNYVEVAFSPQNEINDDINSSMGYFNIGEYIGDPRQISESTYSYPDLDRLRDSYFDKYYKNYNWKDYIRLIKYFDNSLFKMIKDFVPAKSSVATGVVIKQHLLERNKQRPAQVETSLHDYSGSVYSQQMWDPITSGTYVSNSRISKINGGDAGVFNGVNNLGSSPEGQSQGIKNTLAPFVTQSWIYTTQTISGSLIVTQSTQDEFYNGELGGSEILITNGELNTPFVVETANVYEGFIAPYSRVYKNDTSINDPGNMSFETLGKYGTYITSFVFNNKDDNSTERFNYFSQYPNYPFNPGDTLPIKTIKSDDSTQFFNFIVASVEIGYHPVDSIKININPYPIFNYSNPWYESSDGETDFNIEIIRDTSITDLQINLLSDEPLQNNALTSTPSTEYQTIDYSTGYLTPTNIGQIRQGTATPSDIQDSNYSQASWSNIRYRGSRASSPDFNL